MQVRAIQVYIRIWGLSRVGGMIWSRLGMFWYTLLRDIYPGKE